MIASNCDFDEELNCSTVEKKLETNETDHAPGTCKTEDRPHKCPHAHCQKKYKNKGSLTTHMRVHDENKQIKCDVCKVKIFATKWEYFKHMLSHTSDKPHKCPTCNQSFGQLATLKVHQYTHLKEKTFKCPDCPDNRYFQSPAHLSAHRIMHKKEKQYECFICHKEFHRKADLNVHERVHTKVKLFQCGMCQKRFVHSVTLKTHIQAHLGEKPFKCEMCDTDFTTQSGLKMHQKNCARLMVKRPHMCPKCPKKYCNKYELNRHIKIHNKKTTN